MDDHKTYSIIYNGINHKINKHIDSVSKYF
jgi:hypothetical protein